MDAEHYFSVTCVGTPDSAASSLQKFGAHPRNAHMTLRSRLTLGLLTIAVILIVPLLFATRALGRLHSEAKALRDRDFAASLLLGRLRDALNDLRPAETALLFVRDDKSRQTMADRVADVERLADSLQTYELGRTTRDVRTAMQAVSAGARQEFDAAVARQDKTAERISAEQVVPAMSRAEAAVRTAERTLRERTRDRVGAAAVAAKSGSTIAFIGLALALVVAAAIAVRLTRRVSQPVYELERGMRSVACRSRSRSGPRYHRVSTLIVSCSNRS